MTVGVAVGQDPGSHGRGHFLNALRTTFDEQSDRPTVIFPERTETGGDLDRLARTCAAHFQALGVSPGDRVALLTADKRPFLVAHLGAMYAGAVALPLNPRFTRDELAYFLADSGAVAAVVGNEQRPLVESLCDCLPNLRDRYGSRDCQSTSIRDDLSRPDSRCRRTLPDALQLGDDGPAQGGRPHARQSRVEPPRTARLLADRPR